MTTTRSRYIPMGLTKEYAPNWSTWEVVRELVANCKDADPEYHTFHREGDPNFIAFTTSTVPKLAEMIFMGCGHGPDDVKIGQFGEGFKLAALVATRTRDASVRYCTRGHIVTFCFRTLRDFDTPVLTARITDAPANSSSILKGAAFRIELKMKGARDVGTGRFLKEGDKSAAIKKDAPTDHCCIFCKGIFIQELDSPKHTLFHYNLNSLTLNRDRSMASTSSIATAVASLLLYHMTDEIADILMCNPDCWEQDAIETYGGIYQEAPKRKLAAAFRRRYGANAVVAVARDADNELAILRGHKVVTIPRGLAALVTDLPPEPNTENPNTSRIESATTIVPKDANYTSIPNAEAHTAALAECAHILDILCIPASIRIFNPAGRKNVGLAVYCAAEGTCTVWLSEALFAPGQRLERLRTLCHELAHVDTGGAGDLTLPFQYKLDEICGKLATYLLDTR